jgi:hypothetical protein
MIDGPEAALVAASVWFLLASDRFASLKYSLLAAVAVAVGCYSKQTFVLFVGGLVVVMLFRGGWRHWRNLLGFSATVLALALPWYVLHYSDLRGQAGGVVSETSPVWYDAVPYPSRWSEDNFTWYAWSFLNNQVYLPLALFFCVGVGVALWILIRRKTPAGYLPELFAGAAVAYFAVSLNDLDDPRYTLPMLVYVALLGTFWITRLRPPLIYAASAGLVLIFFVNLFTVSFGRGDAVVIETPRGVDSPIHQWELRVLNPDGYTIGGPVRNGVGDDLAEAFKQARSLGFDTAAFDYGSMISGGFHFHGLGALAEISGLQYVGIDPEAISHSGISVFRAAPDDVPEYRPCVIADDGTGFFFTAGPLSERRLFCPASA